MGFQSAFRPSSEAYLAEDHQMPERLFRVIVRGGYAGAPEEGEEEFLLGSCEIGPEGLGVKSGTSYNTPVKRKLFSCDFEETGSGNSFGNTSPAGPFGLPSDSTNLSLRRTLNLIVTFIRCVPLERGHPSSLIQIPKFK